MASIAAPLIPVYCTQKQASVSVGLRYGSLSLIYRLLNIHTFSIFASVYFPIWNCMQLMDTTVRTAGAGMPLLCFSAGSLLRKYSAHCNLRCNFFPLRYAFPAAGLCNIIFDNLKDMIRRTVSEIIQTSQPGIIIQTSPCILYSGKPHQMAESTEFLRIRFFDLQKFRYFLPAFSGSQLYHIPCFPAPVRENFRNYIGIQRFDFLNISVLKLSRHLPLPSKSTGGFLTMAACSLPPASSPERAGTQLSGYYFNNA